LISPPRGEPFPALYDMFAGRRTTDDLLRDLAARGLTAEPEAIELRRGFLLRHDHQVHTHRSVKFDARGRVRDELVTRLPAGHDRIHIALAEKLSSASFPFDRSAVHLADEPDRFG